MVKELSSSEIRKKSKI